MLGTARVTEYKDGVLHATVGDEEKAFPADSVVLCVGCRSESQLFEETKYDVNEIYEIGDAQRVSNIMYAIWDAFEVASHI